MNQSNIVAVALCLYKYSKWVELALPAYVIERKFILVNLSVRSWEEGIFVGYISNLKLNEIDWIDWLYTAITKTFIQPSAFHQNVCSLKLINFDRNIYRKIIWLSESNT